MKKYLFLMLVSLLVATGVHAYTVQPGDTLNQISQDNNISVQEIVDLNDIENPDLIYVGDELTFGYMEEYCNGILCDDVAYLPEVSNLGGTVARRPTEFKSNLGEQKNEGHSDTTLKLTTITTKDGNTLDPAVLGSSTVYSINPGASNSEVVLCTGLTVSTKTATGCTFGYRFDDPTATSSANILAHSPGEPVIISNTDTYNADNFVSVVGDQSITANHTFTNANGVCFSDTDFCIRSNGTNLQWTEDAYTSTFNFTSSSISTLSASSTRAIGITGSEIHVNASTTLGYEFDASGNLFRAVSSTTGIETSADGLKINSTTISSLISTTTPTANLIPKALGTGKLNDGWLSNPLPTAAATTSILYFDGASWVTSTAGITGQVLEISPSTTPEWTDPGYLGSSLNSTFYNYQLTLTNEVFTLNNATFTDNPSFVQLESSGTAWKASGTLPGHGSDPILQFDAAKKTIVEFRAMTVNGTSGDRRIGIANGGFGDVFTADTSVQALFAIDGTTLYASTSNNASAITNTAIAGITVTNWNLYRIEFDQGTDAKFYVNGTLEQTLTTNLPASVNAGEFGFGGTASGEDWIVSHVRVSQEL